MDFSKLKKIYPEATLNKKPFLNEETFRMSYKNQWIHIPKHVLTEKEITILDLLKKEAQPDTFPSTQSKWFQFLEGSLEYPPQTESTIRLIQLVLEKIDNQFDHAIWIDSIAQIFESVLDVFFISQDTCYIIQGHNTKALTQTELYGMLKTLEDDFSIRTNAYIGQFWQPDSALKAILREERQIFQEEYDHLDYRINSLSDVALKYFTKEALAQSMIIDAMKEKILEQPDWKELIFALWENQGNISVAAKQLFVHRNTLQYRIDRFYESTGLSLKDMNDLLLSYLLVS
ncbi:helix-turn-helix domain-containing protein [Alkalibacterium kapii]|uniref:Fis family transcriptional regulator n=1 Tax=Alkalibacterium kapii TaxID=426704 RepID=A0A511AVG4_9LACT|nr:helix-turn-helix domain-containing protein [Alkalibacterium kapii]GEK92134.1 Fis family transcriptional regulator [Alkalibacterium kapii]